MSTMRKDDAMLVNMLYALLLITTTIFSVTFLYNLIKLLGFVYKHYFNNSNTNYEKKNIRKYGIQLIKSTIVVTVLMGIAMINFRPISFEQLLKPEKESFVRSVTAYGSINPDDDIEIKGEASDAIVSLLKCYQYRRTFNGMGGGTGEFLHFKDAHGEYREYTSITIWQTGYLMMPNNRTYRIIEPNRGELYDRLERLIVK
ncbi:MAG: hypothetical protein AB9856_04430 [Cellulosilyticaceae bacterium]